MFRPAIRRLFGIAALAGIGMPPAALAVDAAAIAHAGNGRGAAPCMACHGADGAGQAAAGNPRLAGLDAAYLQKQLDDFASGARNNGIDIAVPAGTAIRATADGVVAYAGDKVAVFGGLVLITHGGGWVSAYGHASRVDVVRGQKVKRGEVVGLSGDSGYASKPKLHFELRKDRVPVNPVAHLPPS